MHVCISGTNLIFDWTVGEILTEQNQFFLHDFTDLTIQMLGNALKFLKRVAVACYFKVNITLELHASSGWQQRMIFLLLIQNLSF